jgi:hypothetical protein
MNLTHDYLMTLHEIDSKISLMKALLAAPKFQHVSISFSTTTAPGQPDRYHRLEDENFSFGLSFELVKMFNQNIDLLEMQKESLLNLCTDCKIDRPENKNYFID